MLADYSEHPEAKDVIETLVRNMALMRSYVLRFFKLQRNKSRILKSMSSPAEFTWTWDRYKKLFLEEKRISNGKKFIKENSALFIKLKMSLGCLRKLLPQF